MSLAGPSRHLAAMQPFSRFRTEADIEPRSQNGLMSTRPSPPSPLRRKAPVGPLLPDQRHEPDGRHDRGRGRSVGLFCQYRELLIEVANRDDHAATSL
jgi:hypothetical protein